MSNGPPGEREDSPRQWCFGCGESNDEGLHIEFEVSGLDVTGRFTPRKSHQGFPGVAHGGIAAAVLDEAMGWAMYAANAWAMTARMEIRYRRPLSLDEPVIVTARVTRDRGRRLEAEAQIATEDGEVLAQADALFLRLPEERSQQLGESFLGTPTA
ncbi:MAG TPA: PaaI family thioesterase [Dehalococcoidia bacterium]|nr:PaaI family thioesterase [Dehalococcoidia bacterium]